MSTSGRNSASSADKAESSAKSSKEKLRSACDNCAGSKVRCTKEQPICQRCQRLGLECVYGPSQRRGKPPMNRRNSHASLSGTVANDTETMGAATDRLTVPEATWVSNRVDTENTYFPAPLELSSSVSWDTYPTLSTPDVGSSFIPIAMPPPSIPYEIAPESQIHSLASSPYASYSSLQGAAFPSVSTVHLSSTVSTNACFNEATAALNALYCLDHQAQIPITINMPMAAGSLGMTTLNITSPSLETVRAAIATVTRLSTCDCANCISDRSMPFLLVTIMSKVLDRLRRMYIVEFRSTQISSPYQQANTGQIPASQWPGATTDNLGNPYTMMDAAPSPSAIREKRNTIASGLLSLLQSIEAMHEQQLIPRLCRIDEAMGPPIQRTVGDMLRQSVTNLRIALEAMRS